MNYSLYGARNSSLRSAAAHNSDDEERVEASAAVAGRHYPVYNRILRYIPPYHRADGAGLCCGAEAGPRP